MSEQEKLERGKRRTKRLMITITVAFLVLMLVIPLASVIASSLKEGIGFYLESISTEYVRSALGVTILATVIAVIVFWNLRRMAFDKIFLSRETDLGDAH